MGYSNQSLFCVGVNMFKVKWPIENSIANWIVEHWDTICEEILKLSRICSVQLWR
jgi:hypothetical protein